MRKQYASIVRHDDLVLANVPDEAVNGWSGSRLVTALRWGRWR